MKRTRWYLHPILILVLSIIALGTSLFLYIHWYLGISTGLKTLAMQLNVDPRRVLDLRNWVVILVLSLLFGIILMGISIIFVYNVKTFHLYRLQNNFINNFTHELKTPVTSLKLYLETLCRHEISREKQLKYLQYMISDVNRLTDNIDRILSLARIESKSFSGEFVRADILSITKQFCENNRHLFGNCEINIHNPGGQTFLCEINSPLFEMLLMNLLTNAVKYNESELPKVEITFTRNKRTFVIEFADNGIGIEKSNFKKIFKKFYQVGTADNMSAMGSGIGLYLAENIVRLHKGKIMAESAGHDQGTVFTIQFPVPASQTAMPRDLK